LEQSGDTQVPEVREFKNLHSYLEELSDSYALRLMAESGLGGGLARRRGGDAQRSGISIVAPRGPAVDDRAAGRGRRCALRCR
ncbi:unnamed protein product, partial [Symbiodinium sp. KB8]